MNKEENKKYLDIVKNGNYDDMFDFGCEVTKRELLEKIDGINGLVEGETQSEDYYQGYNQALQDIKTLIK